MTGHGKNDDKQALGLRSATHRRPDASSPRRIVAPTHRRPDASSPRRIVAPTHRRPDASSPRRVVALLERIIMPQSHDERKRRHPQTFEYVLPGGWVALAGKTDGDNDRLSLSVARANDWWFHVRGMPGSHVILRAKPGAEPDKDTLKQAAAIAAYHSKARNGGVVAVSCTQARYVTKPPGAKPGTVAIRKETVLKVRPALPDGQGASLGTEDF
jgi:hypothetical protein